MYPSVQRLLRGQGIPLDKADIPATGPNGTLLKGDVLAYLGQVKEDYLSAQSQRLNDLSHLDLSYTKNLPVKSTQQEATNDHLENGKPQPSVVEVTAPISLVAIHRCQELLLQSLNVKVPLSKFITQASKIANKEILKQALSCTSKSTVFDTIIGHDQGDKISRFVPYVSSRKRTNNTETKKLNVDSLEFLTAIWPAPAISKQTRQSQETAASNYEIIGVKVTRENKSSASAFLNRIKALLEVEPGQLII